MNIFELEDSGVVEGDLVWIRAHEDDEWFGAVYHPALQIFNFTDVEYNLDIDKANDDQIDVIRFYVDTEEYPVIIYSNGKSIRTTPADGYNIYIKQLKHLDSFEDESLLSVRKYKTSYGIVKNFIDTDALYVKEKHID